MRVIAGSAKGRRLSAPASKRVRPALDQVKEAIFNILFDVTGARVLDLFAGSGVWGLEALSRGAGSVDFVELAPACLSAIRSNVAALQVEDKTRVYRGDALRFVERLAEGEYDIALADPPFSTDQAIRLLSEFRRLAFAKILTIEHRSTLQCVGSETRRYGDVALTFCYAS